LGFTGKQVIHPNHIRLLRYGFSPGNEDLHRSLRILEEAIRANAFLGGAIRFEDEMMDPPMFAKALQLLMRSMPCSAIRIPEL
jgi:citrate lyase subunit beta/citryl-CoA lyase